MSEAEYHHQADETLHFLQDKLEVGVGTAFQQAGVLQGQY